MRPTSRPASRNFRPAPPPEAAWALATSSSSTDCTSWAVTLVPSSVVTPWCSHCHTCAREISAVAASSILWCTGMHPTPRSQASVYSSSTPTFSTSAARVLRPPWGAANSCSSVTPANSGGTLSIWLGPGMCASKAALAMGTRAGWATQVPSCPSRASRSLSAATAAIARSFTAGFLAGICAAMPPMAKVPRRWQVWMTFFTYASRKGVVMPTVLRSGSSASGWHLSFLM
mmetsp:Transcript_17309/g.23797  ORF Transcript_17309/g.23797 Transcript_17309/m.23797 type:complete len:230 (-) Transcript_17309:388-1077(-)